MIPEAAVEAAAIAWVGGQVWQDCDEAWRADYLKRTRASLEAAAPHMIQAAKAGAWDEGHLMGWSEATANELPERESLWRNPYR